MDLPQLLRDTQTLKKNVDSAINLLKDISRLEQERTANLAPLKTKLTKLNQIAEQLGQCSNQSEAIRQWLNSYKEDIGNSVEQLKKQFGLELEQELKKLELSLSGHYPELKTGLFTLELDFDRQQVTIWYGPKQERLGQCRMLASEVSDRLEKAKQKLGSQLEPDELLKRLYTAYSRVAAGKQDDAVPITAVLTELAYIIQGPKFHQDPRRENYEDYGRADFSYDLFRIRQQLAGLLGKKFNLIVATRTNTQRRQDFLWIPSNENGEGTVFSHLQFKEAV